MYVCALDEDRYVARTWNFYLFPRPYGWHDRRFTCQAGSLQFLLEHKFDFNKFIYEVSPCLSLHRRAMH
jgi:poly(A)-specific ribonuclease